MIIIIINFSGAIVLVVIIIALVLYIALTSDLRVGVLTGFVKLSYAMSSNIVLTKVLLTTLFN